LDTVYRHLDACKAAGKLLIVDCCRNTPLTESDRDASEEAIVQAFNESLNKEPPKGIMMITSCAPGQPAKEAHELKHGVFTHYLLEGLKGQATDKDGRISVLSLFSYTNRETKLFVHKRYSGKQTPVLKGEIANDFVLVAPTSVPRPKPSDPGIGRVEPKEAAKTLEVDLGDGVS